MRKIKKVKKLFLLVAVLLMILNSMFPCYAAKKASDATESIVYVVSSDNKKVGSGTGFAIGKVGEPIQYIVTNFHVVQNAYENKGTVKVFFSVAANRFMLAEIYWKDVQKDLAVLKLPEPTDQRKALVLCPMAQTNLDDQFAALGYPAASSVGNDFLKFDTKDITITRGGISKMARVNETDCYQIDINISEGNSGGPLVNSKGEVVGINSFYIQYKPGQDRAEVKTSYAVTIDELIRNINTSVIPITIKNPNNTYLIIAVVIGCVVLIALILFLVLRPRKKSTQQVPTEKVKKLSKKSNFILRCISGQLEGTEYKLEHNIKIGRDSSRCTVSYPINYPGISAIHCEVYLDEAKVYLKDLGSTYGTFYKSEKLTPNTPVMIEPEQPFYLADKENQFIVIIG